MTALTTGAGGTGTPVGADAAVSGHTQFDLPLDRGGTIFIEASAGTGKTHALTSLVARLVLEEEWPIDRILIVTFTHAATAELRDRIRRVLRALLAAARARLAGDDAAEPEVDTQARKLLQGWERREGKADFALAVRRLEAAMHDIDRANVFTIHGFCQRVLADLAFESGFPFGCEVGGDGGRMVAGAVRDFWRRRLYPVSMLRMRHAVENKFFPSELAGWVSKRRAKIGAELAGCDASAEPIETRESAWCEVFDAARSEWERHQSTFRREILEGPWLDRRSYKIPRATGDLADLEVLFTASEPRLPGADACGRYGREKLSKACRKNFLLPDNPLFDALDRLEEASRELRSALDHWLRWTRREALTDASASVRRRIRTDRRLAYDDLLIELDHALASAGGRRLAAQIRRGFPCVLIDEYQDTDPVQARIFGRIYGEDRAPSAGAAREGGDEHADLAGPGSGLSGRAIGVPRSALPGPDASSRADAAHRAESATQEEAGASIRGERPPSGTDASSRTEGLESAGAVAREGVAAPRRGERERPGPFIVVGDPKQSIYRFRGADVFAYLTSRRAADERLHLERNWRSVPALVEAVNAVFAGAAPFVTPEIAYRPVAAAVERDDPLRLPPGESAAPLEFWLLSRVEEGKPLTKKDAAPVVVGVTADRVARLLECGARGEASIDGTPLTGADIAVLVRTHAQGRQMADALRERGVRSVEIDEGSVFGTREAEQLERLLWALAEPGREARVRGALAGDLFGLDARALLALGADEATWSAWIGRLAEWRAHWESRGIGSVLLRLLEGEGGASHLLGHRDGARRLTNFRHLAELLQAAETRERLAPAELAAWLNHRRNDPDSQDDDAKLRIESDEQLVRILTVHGSKGLEFPVVFCPFAWDARSPKSSRGAVDAVYHRGAADGYREVVDLEPDARARAVEWLEEFAESVRLLYVALTRAKFRCVVAWGQVNGAEHSPLAWLLHRPTGGRAAVAESAGVAAVGAAVEEGLGGNDTGTVTGASEREFGGEDARKTAGVSEAGFGEDDTGTDACTSEEGFGGDDPDALIAALEAAKDRFRGLDAQAWLGEMHAFVRRVPGAISVSILDPEPPPAHAPERCEASLPALAAREPLRALRRIRSLTSFTALTAAQPPAGGASAGRSPSRREEAEVDRPDHDQHEAPADAAGDDRAAAGATASKRTVFTFPRGPVAGSCLHRIFERLDESHEADTGGLDLDDVCSDALADFGIDRAWRATARTMVERTRSVLLRESRPEPPERGPGAADPPGSVTGADAGGFRLADPHRRLVELEFHFPVDGLDRDRLAARMVEHGYPDPFAGAARVGGGAPSPPIHGFLRGFVDLVVEHAGRWYVLDYKSSWLGPGPGDYGPDALGAAMREGGYTLQSLIYLVALHRYLAVRLPGYEYGRHVGGAFYLFVRGIDPAAGMDRGVYFDRPTTECLRALDDCFRSGGA